MTEVKEKRLLLPHALVFPLTPAKSDEDDSAASPRKRKRPAELTAEERMEKSLKRKMRNRVASQNTRDRKKVYVQELEEQVKKLKQQNEELLQNNARLQQRTSELVSENAKLMNSSRSVEVGLQAGLAAMVPSESAVFGEVSRQQKPRAPTHHSPTTLLQIWTILGVIFCQHSWQAQKVPKYHPGQPSTSKRMMRVSHRYQQKLLRLQKLWGAHNTTWNPRGRQN